MSIKNSPLPSGLISLATVDALWGSRYYATYERLQHIYRMSKEDFKVPVNRLSKSRDSRETILNMLEKNDVIRGLIGLALILDDQGHPKHAEEAYEKVIEKRREAAKQEDEVILFCQWKTSSMLRQRGLYIKAEDQCRRVLELSIGSTGQDSNLSLQAAGDLALIWRDQGKFGDAFNQIRDILDNETCSPYQDALHLRLVTIFAIILRDYGDYDLSLFLTRNALRVSDKLCGKEDPFTLDLASELSQLLTERSTHRLAEEFARRALDGFAKRFGTDHPQSLKAASRLANAMRFDEQLRDPTELFERTLKAQELQLGSTHPDTVLTKCGLAATYALDARFRDSVSILRQTLIQQNAVFGHKSHPDTVWTEKALETIRTFQKALNTDSTSESELEEESRRMRNFFKTPFRKDQINLQLFDDATLSEKKTEEVRSQSDLQGLAAARDVSTDFKYVLPSSSDNVVSGILRTALHTACLKGNLKLVQQLLNSGEDVDAKGGIFETPLHAASYGGHIEIVKLLLKHKANVEDDGKYGISALQLALSKGYDDLARTLLDAGTDPEVTDHWYGTTLHEASMTGQEYMVDRLLEAKTMPNAVTGIFGTALGAAAWKGNLTIVQSLMGKGATVSIQVDGRTAPYLAALAGHQDIMEVLLKADDNGNETSRPKEKPELFEQKSLALDKPLEKDLKSNEQSEPLEQEPVEDLRPKGQSKLPKQEPLKPSRPIELQKQRSKKSVQHKLKGKEQAGKLQAGKPQAGKPQAGNKKAKLIRLAKGVTSTTKSHIPSSDAWSARFRDSGLNLRKRTPSHLMA